MADRPISNPKRRPGRPHSTPAEFAFVPAATSPLIPAALGPERGAFAPIQGKAGSPYALIGHANEDSGALV
jgi:hypothetical protein